MKHLPLLFLISAFHIQGLSSPAVHSQAPIGTMIRSVAMAFKGLFKIATLSDLTRKSEPNIADEHRTLIPPKTSEIRSLETQHGQQMLPRIILKNYDQQRHEFLKKLFDKSGLSLAEYAELQWFNLLSRMLLEETPAEQENFQTQNPISFENLKIIQTPSAPSEPKEPSTAVIAQNDAELEQIRATIWRARQGLRIPLAGQRPRVFELSPPATRKEDCLGEGTYGKVFLSERGTVIKEFTKKMPRECSNLGPENESRVLGNIAHPVFPLFLAFYPESEKHFAMLEMEKVTGKDMKRKLFASENEEGFSANKTILILVQCLLGLEYLHGIGYAHGDIKPANLMCSDQGCIKIIDFGFCGRRDRDTLMLGTPYYMAPEIFKREYSGFPADIWALGVTVYEMLTGHKLFRAGDTQLLCRKILVLRPVDVEIAMGLCVDADLVSNLLYKTIREMLTIDPKQRPTAAQLLQRLQRSVLEIADRSLFDEVLAIHRSQRTDPRLVDILVEQTDRIKILPL